MTVPRATPTAAAADKARVQAVSVPYDNACMCYAWPAWSVGHVGTYVVPLGPHGRTQVLLVRSHVMVAAAVLWKKNAHVINTWLDDSADDEELEELKRIGNLTTTSNKRILSRVLQQTCQNYGFLMLDSA